MGLFDIFKDPEELIKDDSMLRVQLWSGRESDDTYQVEMTKRKLLAESASYKAKGIYIMAVWDTTWRSNLLGKLTHQMNKLTGYSEYEPEDDFDLVFYDGPSGSFSFSSVDEDLFNGELNVLNPINSNTLDEYNIDYVYHMTHYSNVRNVIEHDLRAHENKYVNKNIDNDDVNNIRNKREPINNRKINKYVPFYFNPRNPMLYVNKEIQEDIVILAFDRRIILKEGTLFTDGNAASSITNFYDDIEDLGQLDWDIIKSSSWTEYDDGKRKRMAEVLVRKKVSSGLIKKIYCYDRATADIIEDLKPECEVEIGKHLYF